MASKERERVWCRCWWKASGKSDREKERERMRAELVAGCRRTVSSKRERGGLGIFLRSARVLKKREV